MVEAAERVRRVLAADFAAMLALSPEGGELRLVASQWSTAPPDPFSGLAETGSQPCLVHARGLRAGRDG